MRSFEIRFTSNDPTARFSWLPSAVASGFNPRCSKRNTFRSYPNSENNRNPAHTLIFQRPSGEPQQPSNTSPSGGRLAEGSPAGGFIPPICSLPKHFDFRTKKNPAKSSQPYPPITHSTCSSHPLYPCPSMSIMSFVSRIFCGQSAQSLTKIESGEILSPG
jgi:hypothetical protein